MSQGSAEASFDLLSDVLLRVARRADVIARGQPKASGLDLHCWLLAEREILGEHPAAMTAANPRAADVAHAPQ